MLYKFIERDHLNSFFNNGCLRLGTLYDFKDTILHGETRGDTSEAEHHLIRDAGESLILSPKKYEPLFSEMFDVQGVGEITFSNLSIVAPRKTEDAFIFCSSYIFNEKLFRKWLHEENLDSCYKISNPRGFFSEISKAIESSAYFYANLNITYTEEYIEYNSAEASLNPAFTKHKEKYDWQFENRSVWPAKGPYGNLKPWIIHAPKAIQYCRPFASIDDESVAYYKA